MTRVDRVIRHRSASLLIIQSNYVMTVGVVNRLLQIDASDTF